MTIESPHTCAHPDCAHKVYSATTFPLCSWHAFELWDRMQEFQNTPAATAATRIRLLAKEEAEQRAIDAAHKVRGEKPGFVYYLRVDTHIKIGFARDVKSRLPAYPPSATLLAVEPGSLQLESERHRHFAAFRDAGREWFTPSPELDAHIAALIEQHGDPAKFAHRYKRPRTQAMQVPSGAFIP